MADDKHVEALERVVDSALQRIDALEKAPRTIVTQKAERRTPSKNDLNVTIRGRGYRFRFPQFYADLGAGNRKYRVSEIADDPDLLEHILDHHKTLLT